MTWRDRSDILEEDINETTHGYEQKEDINETTHGYEQENGRTMKQHIRLLIADDSHRSRGGLHALLATLRTEEHQGEARPEVEVVAEAADGREAVRMVEQFRPDVVLMDARMPAMDGLEATRLIKNKWPEVRTEALAAGADAFLVKGCPPEHLLEAILS
jgi:DNA-binding NarL/FixJ family response regulator